MYSAFSIKLFSEDYDTRIVTILRLQTLLINIGGQVGYKSVCSTSTLLLDEVLTLI